MKKQIEEMVKHCPCYIGEKCCIDNESPERCDMVCQFGTYAEALYNAGYRKQEWISVDERLPESNKQVLVYYSVGKIDTDHYIRVDGIEFWFEDFDGLRKVTHWMPLPEPPKMKGGAE